MCRVCRRAREKRRYDRDPKKFLDKDKNGKSARGWKVEPTKQRAYNLKTKFGISLEEYGDMLERQGGVCKICKNACLSGNNLAVDHNHDTGQVRDLLCIGCNTGLGSFRDNREILESAVAYLEEHSSSIKENTHGG